MTKAMMNELKARQFGAVVLGKYNVPSHLLFGKEALELDEMLTYCSENNLLEAKIEIENFISKQK